MPHERRPSLSPSAGTRAATPWFMTARQEARVFTFGSVQLEYLLYLPRQYAAEPERRWPLVLFLHGAGERGRGTVQRVATHGIPKLVERGRDFPFVCVSPQCPPEWYWTQLTPALRGLLGEVSSAHRIDPERVALTGLSMGGFGTWKLAAEDPDAYAAIAPICGGGDPAWAPRLRYLPIWAFHGEDDDVVPASHTIDIVEALRRLGGNVRFTLYPGVEHDSWTRTYDDPELYDWLLRYRRGDGKPTLG